MPIPAIRTKQTTSTTGTGTLTLNAAAADFRSFNAAFGGASSRVRYALSRAGVYEIGYGTFNGGSPGTLTRVDVIASSNGGSLVNLAPGTTDVFFDFLPGDRPIRAISASATMDLADIGNLIRYTGTADATLTLPAAASVPTGSSVVVKNDSTNWSILSIDPNGSELIEGDATPFPLFAFEAVEIFNIGTAWRFGARPGGERLVARSAAAASASIDFILPMYKGAQFAQFRVHFARVRPGADGAVLWLRTSSDGGATFNAGATDYDYSRGFVSGAAAWTADAPAALAQIPLTTDIDNTAAGNTAHGNVLIDPGSSAARFAHVLWDASTGGNGGTFAGLQRLVGSGRRLAAADVNGLRFLPSSGTIGNGVFQLFATYS